MSLSSQLDNKNSTVSMFFHRYEDKQGVKECLAELQSTKEIKKPSYEPASRPVWGLIGTTTDYLLRYVANNNRLDFNQTIANAATRFFQHLPDEKIETINVLYGIGQVNLDGRRPDEAAVYSATALSLLDNVYRSGGRLPAYFDESIADDGRLDSLPRDYGLPEKLVMLRYYDYFCEQLGGKSYAQDILEIIDIFASAQNNCDDEFSDTSFTVFNRALGNSYLVGGADFDCVISKNKKKILTDIKTTINPLPKLALWQLIGYALLHDDKKDQFKIDGVGIYFSRSGSFRHLPTSTIIQKCFPSLKTVDAAKKAFIKELQDSCPSTDIRY
jgi:hypothetical protein